MPCCFKDALGSEDCYHNLHDDQSSPSRRRNRTLKLLNGSVEESAGIQAGAVAAPLVCNTNVYKYNLVCNANNPTCAVVFTNVTLHWCTPLHTKTCPLVCNKYYALYTLVCNRAQRDISISKNLVRFCSRFCLETSRKPR